MTLCPICQMVQLMEGSARATPENALMQGVVLAGTVPARVLYETSCTRHQQLGAEIAKKTQVHVASIPTPAPAPTAAPPPSNENGGKPDASLN